MFRTGAISITLARAVAFYGVELAGFIGYPTLKELVIAIDYRDNLVPVTYTPHVEAH